MQNLDKKTDSELVKLILENDKNEDYLYELFDRYESKLLRYLHTFGLDKESSEDVLQEVYIKSYKNLNSFDISLKFSSWIYRITHNEAISYIRSHKKQKLNQYLGSEDQDLIHNLIDESVDVEKEISDKEMIKTVNQALKIVPEKYRDVLVLKYFEGKSYDEISDILQIPSGTVATYLNRGKNSFKSIFKNIN